MKIKHYTFFTESHRVFLKYFLNTFTFDPDIDLNIRFMVQECESGVFVSEGWNKTMERKVNYIVEAFDELKDGDMFIHTDADVIFLKPYKQTIIEEINGVDLIFQSDMGTACMGFFACIINQNTRKLFLTLQKEFKNHYHDQEAMNFLLRSTDHNVKVKLFSHKIFNHGFLGKNYNNETSLFLPQDIVALHANYAIGVESKVNLIKAALNTKK